MSALLTRKLRRDLLRERGQALAVLSVTALGVLVFVASAGSYRDLRDSYAATRTRLALASLHVVLPVVEPDDVRTVGAVPGVALVETRAEAELPVSVGTHRATLRLLSLPDEGEPRLDRLQLVAGALPGPGQLVLEQHFARFHGLEPGARVDVAGTSLEVTGVVVSAEYLWVARNEHDFLTPPAQFGVAWARRAVQRRVAAAWLQQGGDTARAPAVEVAAGPAPGNQLLVQAHPDVSPAALAKQVTTALGAGRALAATPADELVSTRLMQMDLDGYKGMAAFFPLFFLLVSAFIVGATLARLVDAQRVTIGTLMALGLAPSRLLAHYLGHAAALGGLGAVLGAVVGELASPFVSQSYAQELGIPSVDWQLHPDLVLEGLAMGLGVSLLAGLLPALHATRLQPAEAMRPPVPRLGRLAGLVRHVPLPLSGRLALRGLLGRPLRSLGTILGVASAMVLVLSTGVLLDAMKTSLGLYFEKAQTYDVRVDFAAPSPASEVLEKARAAPGVVRAETLFVAPARLEAQGRHADVMLQAPDEDATLVRPVDVDGSVTVPGAGGLAVTRATAKKLGVQPGDTVRVTLPPLEPVATLRITGFADATMGSSATMHRATLDQVWGLAGLATTLVGTAKPGGAAAARDTLAAAFPHAVRVDDAASLREQLQLLMGLGWVMLSAMLLFACVLAGAILFNTATLSVLERQRDLATLRALGGTMRELTVSLSVENGLLTLLGLGVGLPLAIAAARALLATFESDLFSLPFVLSPGALGLTLGGIFVLVLLAQAPALRRVARANLAEAVRAREG